MSGRIVTGALVATALGVGVVVGLAAPNGKQTADVGASPGAQDAQLVADAATKSQWVEAIAESATSGRLEGIRVALVITDGTPEDAVDQVTAALSLGGATVAVTARLGADWWEPSRSSFRGELASQISGSVVGVDGLGSTQVLEHAIVQAMVPGALPRGAVAVSGFGAPAADLAEGTSNHEVLLEVLTRAEILTLDRTAIDGVDAFVIVTGDGPAGAGAAVNASASVWEQYLSTTGIVVASKASATAGAASGTLPVTASDAIAAGSDSPAATRPSVVVLSDPALASVQIVMALKEQATGGTGTYGTAAGLAIVAIP